MNTESPVNSLPPVIVVLCLMAVLAEIVVSAGAAGLAGGQMGVGWRMGAVQDYAFVPAVLDIVVSQGDYSIDLLKRFVMYPFIHQSFTQTLFAGALLLALGKFVGDIFGGVATLILFLACTIVGAVVYGLLVNTNYPLVGLYPPVYGFIGAYTYVVWLRLGAMGQNQLQAFRLIGFLLGLQLLFGLLFGSDPTWIAELTGFFVGLFASTVLAPGGWTAMLKRIRRD